MTTTTKPSTHDLMGMRGVLGGVSEELRLLEMLLNGPIEICRHTSFKDEIVRSINIKLRDFRYDWMLQDDGEFLSLIPTGPQPEVSTTA